MTLLYLGALAHLIIWIVCALNPEGHLGDFQRYREIAIAATHEPTNAPVEYPPGAVMVFGLAARLTDGPARFYLTVLLLNLIADALIVVALVDAWGLAAGVVYLAVSAPLVSLLFFRYDLWSVAMATGGAWTWVRGHDRRTIALLGAGVSLKLWPLPLCAWYLGRARRTSRPVRSLWPLALTCLGALGGWIAYAGVEGLLGVLTFRGATGWGIESSVGSLWRIVDPASVRLEAGAIRAGSIAPWLPVVLFLVALPLAAWSIHRGVAADQFGRGWVTGIGALLACSALLSPQFLAWMLPGGAIAWVEGDRRTTRWVAWLIGLTVLYRVLRTTQMPGLVLLRNALLLVMVGEGLWRLSRRLPAESGQHGAVFRVEPTDPPTA